MLVYNRKGDTHDINSDNPHINSYAAYLLMKDAYHKLERDIDLDDVTTLPKSGRHNWKLHLAFNTRFLERQLAAKGVLTCVYCQKTNLVIDSTAKSVLATADHVVPIMNGGAPFDEANLVVACDTCNKNKGSKDAIIVDGKYSF